MNLLRSVTVAENPNKKWEKFCEGRTLGLRPNPIYDANSSFFLIGSCFAEEVRKALSGHQKCYPRYERIVFDPTTTLVDTLNQGRYHMNYYNTFSICQEFERAIGLWEQGEEDIWCLSNKKIEGGRLVSTSHDSSLVYQDPYRRNIFARSRAELMDVIRQINSEIVSGLKQANVIVMTLGMTEIFRINSNGRACNQMPLHGGAAVLREVTFHASDYTENLDNMLRIYDAIKIINPTAQIVVSVSPVPMHRSFAKEDVFLANFLSKTTLRSVAAALVCRHPDVIYFPSFEIVWGLGASAYKEDLLHVRPELVELIIKMFSALHCRSGEL